MTIDKKDNAVIIFMISVCVVVLSSVISTAFYHINDRSLMSKNISEAVTKGMDPLAVRCAYADSTDTICVAYAASTNRK